jgi:hypothetical protein
MTAKLHEVASHSTLSASATKKFLEQQMKQINHGDLDSEYNATKGPKGLSSAKFKGKQISDCYIFSIDADSASIEFHNILFQSLYFSIKQTPPK